MPLKEIIDVYSENHSEHINKNAWLLIVKADGIYSCYWVLKCYIID
jgi:hypothetical protein